jgi:hypothetical protein
MDAKRLLVGIRRWPLGWIALVAAAALPFLASLGFCSVSRTPRKSTGVVDRPSLIFDQYFVNLSELHNAARVEAWYHFKNTGKTPARITNLDPSCGCLNPKVEKREYLPGEECEFSLGVLMTREKPGPHDYFLRIDYQDPKPRSVTVAFKVVVRREVTVRPSQLMFFQSGTEGAPTQSILISDMRPTPFRVTGATCKSPLVKFQIGPATDDPDAGRETTVFITVEGQVPQQGVKTAVILSTDDPHYLKIPIPIWISNMHSSSIQRTSATAVGTSRPGS